MTGLLLIICIKPNDPEDRCNSSSYRDDIVSGEEGVWGWRQGKMVIGREQKKGPGQAMGAFKSFSAQLSCRGPTSGFSGPQKMWQMILSRG